MTWDVEEGGGRATRDARAFSSGGGNGRPHYVVTRRHGEEAPELLRVELGSGEKALLVFFSGWSAHNFVFSNGLEREWRVGERSPGELRSLLAAPLARVDWVLLDPPVRFATKDASPSVTHRGNFLEYLGAHRTPSRSNSYLGGLDQGPGERVGIGARGPKPPEGVRTRGNGLNERVAKT